MKHTRTQSPLVLLSLMGLLSLAGCGGGDTASGTPGASTTPSRPAPNNHLQPCHDTHGDHGLSQAATLYPGIRLAPAKPHTRLRLWHLSDGTRKACIVEGEVRSDG